jgi:hypothetical protein
MQAMSTYAQIAAVRGGEIVLAKAARLERFPLRLNRKALFFLRSGRIFCGKPASTFPENALSGCSPAEQRDELAAASCPEAVAGRRGVGLIG